MNLLFVCTGNICRSPMAEGIARHRLATGYPEFSESVNVASAGVAALAGNGPTAEALETMAAMGIDISAHRARDVERRMLAGTDLALTMEDGQTRAVLSLEPRTRACSLLRVSEVAGALLASPGALDGLEVPALRLRRLWEGTGEMERDGDWLLERGAYDVEDPYGRAREFYEWAACRIEEAVRTVLETVFGRRPRE